MVFGEDVPEASGEMDMASEEILAVSSEEEEPEWNLETLFGSIEHDASQRGRVRRRPAHLRDYCT